MATSESSTSQHLDVCRKRIYDAQSSPCTCQQEYDRLGVELSAKARWHAEAIAQKDDLIRDLCDAILACETKHDERGRAYLAVPARSIFDLGAQIKALRESLEKTVSVGR